MLSWLAWPSWYRGNLPWLFAGRAVRSFTQAALVVMVPLYVATAGFSALQVGYLISITSVGSVFSVLFVGVLSDRYGRKAVLIGLTLLAAAGSAVYAVTTAFWPLALMGAVASVGRGGGAGSGGSWGPFYPAEQPLIASSCSDRDRNAVFAGLALVGVLAGAAGSLAAALPAVLRTRMHLSAVAAFQPVFWLTAILALAIVGLIVPIREVRTRPAAAQAASSPAATRDLITRLWLTNTLNGVAFGVLGPFTTYWFFVRYGAGPAEVGTLYTVVNLMTAFSYLASARTARRLGAVQAVAVTRAGGAALLAGMAFAPTYLLAAVLYTVRLMITAIGMPIRQSFVMGVAAEGDRSKVAALGSLPSQIATTFSPTLASYLLADVSEAAPMLFATVVVAASGVVWARVFRHTRPPEERGVSA